MKNTELCPLRTLIFIWILIVSGGVGCHAQQKVIIDTDIGDDIDDAFAVALALRSPELKLLALTSAWGDTKLRTRLLDRFLQEAGRNDIPVGVGVEKHHEHEAAFSQARWSQRQTEQMHSDAASLILETIRSNPGEVTLIEIAPMTNLAAAFRKDPTTFRQLKRIVMMGGSIKKGFDDLTFSTPHGPVAEYNIQMDVAAAQQVFMAGVPIFQMPLDSTQVRLDDVQRSLLFTASEPLSDALTLLYQQWTRTTRIAAPILFDVLAVAFTVDPGFCETTPMHIAVDDDGFTKAVSGPPNSFVCLHSDEHKFFNIFLGRLLAPADVGRPQH